MINIIFAAMPISPYRKDNILMQIRLEQSVTYIEVRVRDFDEAPPVLNIFRFAVFFYLVVRKIQDFVKELFHFL